jgi:hypothetical protein
VQLVASMLQKIDPGPRFPGSVVYFWRKASTNRQGTRLTNARRR